MRKSIEPTYDHRETGDRFVISTGVGEHYYEPKTIRDPFVFHRIVIHWHDLLRGLFHGRLVVVVTITGDPEIVDDVMELDADCLTMNSTRRQEWDMSLERALGDFAAVAGEHSTD